MGYWGSYGTNNVFRLQDWNIWWDIVEAMRITTCFGCRIEIFGGSLGKLWKWQCVSASGLKHLVGYWGSYENNNVFQLQDWNIWWDIGEAMKITMYFGFRIEYLVGYWGSYENNNVFRSQDWNIWWDIGEAMKITTYFGFRIENFGGILGKLWE